MKFQVIVVNQNGSMRKVIVDTLKEAKAIQATRITFDLCMINEAGAMSWDF